MSKKVLGKGLEALIPQTVSARVDGESVFHVPISTIEVNPNQPRKVFDVEKLAQLAASIKEDGVLQPIVVRRRGTRYELIMGERRFQAAKQAGETSMPVVVKDVKDRDSLRLALVENIQRENLNVIEVALAYRQLVGTFGLTQAELADQVGKDRSSVANTLRLLNLPDEVQKMVSDAKITGGHARALLALPTQKEQLALARRIVEQNLSVRQIEAETGVGSNKKSAKAPKERPAHLQDLEKSVASHLGTKVSIDEKRGGKGKITIEFYSHDDFERLTSLMGIPLPR
jgi:ParB family chromosome partitioning protein